MNRYLPLYILVFLTSSLHGQKSESKITELQLVFDSLENYSSNTISFCLGYSCFPTSNVELIEQLLKEKEYNYLINLLYSKNQSVKILAALVTERLYYQEVIKLKAKQLGRIRRIINSKKKVNHVVGCVYREKTTYNDIDKEVSFKDDLMIWLNRVLPESIIEK